MRAADTNILVRLTTRDATRQMASAESLSRAVLGFLCWLWHKRAGYLSRAIEMLLSHRDLVLQDSETVAAALELFRAKPGLGFSDCMMLQLARKAGHLPLGTFDRSLARLEGAERV
jgi:predicted nucleic acid-binding protein